MTASSVGLLRVAEDVTSGHVDRVADAIAERIVDEALAIDPLARTGVEVAISSSGVLVTGFVSLDRSRGSVGSDLSVGGIERFCHEALDSAGHVGVELPVTSVLVVDDMEPGERESRPFSDDQSIVVGHASPSAAHRHLPIEVVAARAARAALEATSAADRNAFGPDGKVLVGVREFADGSAELEFVTIAQQHRVDIGYGKLHSVFGAPVLDALRAIDGLRVPDALDPSTFVLNGRGAFVAGGPLGDNGLSGKKLVCDLYGPRVPIGGGAIAGKDQFKADRAGVFAARRAAVRLATSEGVAATVGLGWFAGGAEPRFVQAELADGRVLDQTGIEAIIGSVDLSLSAIVRDLFPESVGWVDAMKDGYVGIGQRWDRA